MKDNNKMIKNNSVEKENMTLKKKINALIDKIKEKKIYLDYKTRLIIFALLIILSASSTILLAQSFINASSSKKINYDEMSNIDYKVYLKDNNFYDSEYIEKIYNEYPNVRGYLTNLSLINGNMAENYIAAFMPIFNFADTFIVISVFLIIIDIFRGERLFCFANIRISEREL